MREKQNSKMEISKKAKVSSLWLVIGFLGVLTISGLAVAFSGSAGVVIEECTDCFSSQGGDLGASGTRFPSGISADSTSPTSGQIRGTTFTATGAMTVGSTLDVTGAVTMGSTASTTGDLYVSGGTIDITTTTATSTAGLFVRTVPADTSTSTISGGNAEGDVTAGCIELVTSAGAYVRTYVAGGTTALVTEAGRCQD